MKTIFSPVKHSYLAKIGILLIAVALVAAILSCNGTAPLKYNLTMAENPAAGGTATDLTGTSPYARNTEVDIKAVPNTGYEFVGWTAPAGAFDDEDAEETTFTMPAQDVTVTANFVPVYDLTMAVNPVGGGTATDETGTSPYAEDKVVDIKAVANTPYQFVKWTTSAGGTFADENAATTTFTMPAEDVTVTAHFVGPPDHFKGYWADDVTGEPIDEVVYLEDQFGAVTATVGDAWAFCNPAEKQHEGEPTPISNPDHHYTVYDISYDEMYQERQVEVDNQFGTQQLTVWGPVALAVPTTKEGHEEPVGLDHYLLYMVDKGPYQEVAINLTDQFDAVGPAEVTVYEPVYFANPVRKEYKGEVTEIVNPDVHTVIYWIDGEPFETQIQVDNQFGPQTLDVDDPICIAVPSEKLAPPVPPLDHFKCYGVVGAPPLEGVYVDVMDQFDEYWNVQVNYADWFCNPVMKNAEPIVNHDNHLTVYSITPGYQEYWYVGVDNQFGYQELLVYGPVALAAPTWKLYPNLHGPPMYLDHYLLYEVVEGSPVGATVDLDDQFLGDAPQVSVTLPRYFANPVLYKYHDDTWTGVWDPEAHLVFYDISPNFEWEPGVGVVNQFEIESSLDLLEVGQLLGVPSEKLYYEPYWK